MKEKKNNHYNCRHLQDAKHAPTDWMDNKREMFRGKTFKTSDCKVTGVGRGITKSSVLYDCSARLRAPWRPPGLPYPTIPATCSGLQHRKCSRRQAELI